MDDLNISETELRYFGDLFLCCDTEKIGKVPILKATELFRSANLSSDVIRQIFALVGISSATVPLLQRYQFYACLKLIAAHQASLPLRKELLTATISLPLPRFNWKESSPTQLCQAVAASPSSSPFSLVPCIDDNLMQLQQISAGNERASENLIELARDTHSRHSTRSAARHSQQMTHNLQHDHTLDNGKVADMQSTDSEIEHNDADATNKRRISQNSTNTTKSAANSVGGTSGSPEAWSTASDSPTPTNSIAERPWAKGGNLWQGLLCEEQRQLLGTEEESSDRHSSDDDDEDGAEIDLSSFYQITPEQREYYTKQFLAVQPDASGLLAGHVAKVFFEKSRIAIEELRHIWQLCDVTKDGALTLDEFTAAMHLVVLRRNNIPLPVTLPACLMPAARPGFNVVKEPPVTDLLHLDDDDDDDDDTDGERNVTTVEAIDDQLDQSLLNSQDDEPKKSGASSPSNVDPTSSATSSPPILSAGNHVALAGGQPPPPYPAPLQNLKDWSNQSKEWTKFTESPTSNVSSPGPKPVNFDEQRTAQAVVSDPQILHPVPLRVTPLGPDTVEDERINAVQLMSGHNYSLKQQPESLSSLGYEPSSSSSSSNAVATLDSNDLNSTAPAVVSGSRQSRDFFLQTDFRAIQRPQPKKLVAKNVGAIPPPPQRESVTLSGPISIVGTTSQSTTATIDENVTTTGGVVISLCGKKEPPPLPPPRPHRHARSSSLDLNKLKLAPEVPPRVSPQPAVWQQVSCDASFADFAHFPDPSGGVPAITTTTTTTSSHHAGNNHPRPTIPFLQTSQRASAFEVYRKPTPHSTDVSPTPPQPPPSQSATGSSYDKRVNSIGNTLRHLSVTSRDNPSEVLKQLKEQNTMLLKMCADLSEELLAVQQQKEELKLKAMRATSAVSASNASTSAGTGGVNANTVTTKLR